MIRNGVFARWFAAATVMCWAFAPVQAQTFDPVSWGFGDVPVGVSSPTRAFVFSNTSPDALDIVAVEIGGDDSAEFDLIETDCVGQLQAAGTCNIVVAFAPSQAGAASAMLHVGASDPMGGAVNAEAPVSGNGLAEAADLTLDLSIVPPSEPPIEPPEFVAGTPVMVVGTVANLGVDAAQNIEVSITLPPGVAAIEASGVGWTCAAAFEAVTCTRASLVANASALFDMQFAAPQALGPHSFEGAVGNEILDPDTGNNASSRRFVVVEGDVPPPPPASSAAVYVPVSNPASLLLLGACVVLLAWMRSKR